jgi:hypothetical protein
MMARGANGTGSPRKAVARLLARLLERAEAEAEEGRLAFTKPRDLLEAAKMLLLLDGDTSGEKGGIGRDIVERLRRELGVDDEKE